jgi:hypothetical protein
MSVGSGSGSMAAETSLRQKGMSTKSAVFPDASTKLGKASVNDGATRSETAPTPKTLGDRTA